MNVTININCIWLWPFCWCENKRRVVCSLSSWWRMMFCVWTFKGNLVLSSCGSL